jgi:hypothetical protein
LGDGSRATGGGKDEKDVGLGMENQEIVRVSKAIGSLRDTAHRSARRLQAHVGDFEMIRAHAEDLREAVTEYDEALASFFELLRPEGGGS